MLPVLEQSERILIRQTRQEDLDFVTAAEIDPENSLYVGQWTLDQHQNSLCNADIFHIFVESKVSQKPVGYAIMAGVTNPNRNLELKRIVITDKGKGFGKETLRLIKRYSFAQLNVHRLWLDVRNNNPRAYSVYKSEGFVEEGILRECIYLNDGFISLSVMSILENEYRAGK